MRTFNRASAVDLENKLGSIVLIPGAKYKLLHGYTSTMSESWLHTGDIVRVIRIYKHVVLVERVRPNRHDGSHCRECFRLADAAHYLKPLE